MTMLEISPRPLFLPPFAGARTTFSQPKFGWTDGHVINLKSAFCFIQCQADIVTALSNIVRNELSYRVDGVYYVAQENEIN